MKISSFILFGVLPLSLLSCKDSTQDNNHSTSTTLQKEPVPTDWNTLSDTPYEINYPPDWHSDQSGQIGTTFILFSPSDQENDDFKENLTLMVEELPGSSINLEAYTISSKKQIEQIITDAKISSSENIRLNGQDAHKLMYTGKQGVLDLHFLQYIFVKNKTAYVLTFTSKTDTYVNYEELANQIMNTFTLKD